MKPLIKFFCSLELTLGCLLMSMVVIFFGTIDQIYLGIHGATEKYFYSFFVYAHIEPLDLRIPYLPGGYLIGVVMLLNLAAMAFIRFKLTKAKFGIWLIHIGVMLLLVGEFVSSVFQEEASMTIDEGATINYTESFRKAELAIIDTTRPDTDRVYAVPEKMLERRQQISHDELPFIVSIDSYMPNSILQRRSESGGQDVRLANRGHGLEVIALNVPETGKTDERNIPAAVVTIFENNPKKTDPEILGTWLVREFMPPQEFSHRDRKYTLDVRRQREYLPYEITLLDFSHDRYLGTNIPKNFSSQVILRNPSANEEREFLIYMNNPLRYDDLTFYQQGFMNDDRTTILQVVRNPGRFLPYISCIILTLGLLYQFLFGLRRFLDRRSKTA